MDDILTDDLQYLKDKLSEKNYNKTIDVFNIIKSNDISKKFKLIRIQGSIERSINSSTFLFSLNKFKNVYGGYDERIVDPALSMITMG